MYMHPFGNKRSQQLHPRFTNTMKVSMAAAIVLSLSLLLLLPIAYEYNIAPFVLAQKQQQHIFGVGAGILPNDVPTLFSFVATRNDEQNKKVSGQFECFAVMPNGKT